MLDKKDMFLSSVFDSYAVLTVLKRGWPRIIRVLCSVFQILLQGLAVAFEEEGIKT